MMDTGMFLAQATAGGELIKMLPTMMLVFGIFYFMMIRPQQRKEKERLRMITELRAGQRIMFARGLVGTITEARESTFMVEIAPKVVIEVARGAVSRTLAEGEKATVEDAR